MKKTLLGLALAAAAVSANASDLYYGVSLSSVDYKLSAVENRYSLAMLTATVGWEMTDNIAFEGRLGKGVSGDSTRYEGSDVGIDLGVIMGAYARYNFDLNDDVKPYVILGYSHLSGDMNIDDAKGSAHDSDISYGVGANMVGNDNFSMNLEYMSMYEEVGEKMNVYTLGAEYSF